jgi:hypothetical protein
VYRCFYFPAFSLSALADPPTLLSLSFFLAHGPYLLHFMFAMMSLFLLSCLTFQARGKDRLLFRFLCNSISLALVSLLVFTDSLWER